MLAYSNMEHREYKFLPVSLSHDSYLPFHQILGARYIMSECILLALARLATPYTHFPEQIRDLRRHHRDRNLDCRAR